MTQITGNVISCWRRQDVDTTQFIWQSKTRHRTAMCWFSRRQNGRNPARAITSSPSSFEEEHIFQYITMRLSVLLCAAGLTAVSAFAPISPQAGVSTSLRAVNDDSTVGAFDPLNLASENAEETSNGSISGMGLAAATTAAWVASSDVASAAGPDWGIFEGVSFLFVCTDSAMNSHLAHAVQLLSVHVPLLFYATHLQHHII